MVNPFNTALFLGVLRGIVGGGVGPFRFPWNQPQQFCEKFLLAKVLLGIHALWVNGCEGCHSGSALHSNLAGAWKGAKELGVSKIFSQKGN